MLPCSSYSACGLLSRHNFVGGGGRKWKPMATNAGVEPCPFRQKQTIQQVAARCCQWQPCTRHRGFVICVSVQLLCYVFLFMSFFFFSFWRACFRAFAGKAGSVSDDLSLIWSFRLIKEVHSRVILPSCRGGFCSTYLKYAYDLVSSCRSRWHETPLKLSLYPHDATQRKTRVVYSSFAPFPKICFLQIFYRFQKSVVFFCCCLF